MSAINNGQAVAAIHNAEPFHNTTGSLRSRYLSKSYELTRGRMPAVAAQLLAEALIAAESDGQPLYVVYSYATPIAWAREGDLLTVADVRYSVTTSRHQALCLGRQVGEAHVATGQRVIESSGV